MANGPLSSLGAVPLFWKAVLAVLLAVALLMSTVLTVFVVKLGPQIRQVQVQQERIDMLKREQQSMLFREHGPESNGIAAAHGGRAARSLGEDLAADNYAGDPLPPGDEVGNQRQPQGMQPPGRHVLPPGAVPNPNAGGPDAERSAADSQLQKQSEALRLFRERLDLDRAKYHRQLEGTQPRLIVHCFTFNRPPNFDLLWTSLMRAKPVKFMQSSIVLHSEFDPDNSLEWREQREMLRQLDKTTTPHGPVTVVYNDHNMGLKETMMQAWLPTPHSYALFLEDDVEISSLLLVVAEAMTYAYGETETPDDSVLGLRLYNQKWDESNLLKEPEVRNGFLPYKINEPCSWGTVFFPKPYGDFLRWYQDNKDMDPLIPYSWTNAWDAAKSAKKYVRRWMWEKAMFLVSINYPERMSLSTNHLGSGTNIRTNAPWYSKLKERLELPLLTEEAASRWRSVNILDFPPAQSLWMYNASHVRIQERTEPDPKLLLMFQQKDQMPPEHLLNPRHIPKGGVRQRIINRAKERLLTKQKGGDDEGLGAKQRRVASLGLADVEALQAILQNLPLTPTNQTTNAHLSPDFLSLVRKTHGTDMLFALVQLVADPRHRGLVVDVQYGLANRLRALASARAVARASKRTLAIIWRRDKHCKASFQDLFQDEARNDFLLLDDLSPSIVAHPDFQRLFEQYNLLQLGPQFSVNTRSRRHIYVVSPYSLITPERTYRDELAFSRKIMTLPAKPVSDFVDKFYEDMYDASKGSPATQHKKAFGTHIRMISDPHQDVAGLTQADIERFQEGAMAFRVSCDVQHFLQIMRGAPKTTMFFLAADSVEAYRAVLDDVTLAGRVTYLDRGDCMDREARCVQYAMADLLLLSRTHKMLTSQWSSFSILAARLGGMPTKTGCEEPQGGWVRVRRDDPESALKLAEQARKYLQAKHIIK